MRSGIVVIGRDAALRAHLARLLTHAGYRVEVSESAAHASRSGLERVALAIVAPEGLDAGETSAVKELRATLGEVLLVATPGQCGPRAGMLDVSDEPRLLARIAEALAPGSAPRVVDSAFEFAGFRFDLGGHTLIDQSGKEVPLTQGEFALLRTLAERPGRVLSRDRLMQLMAGRDAEAYERSVDMQVMRLRRKIELDPKRPRLIVTVPGGGYKFAPEVREAKPVSPSPLQQALIDDVAHHIAEGRGPTALFGSRRWNAIATGVAVAILAATYVWQAGVAPRLLSAHVEDKLKTAPRLSLVVLPLEEPSDDPEQQYFADAVTDDLTTALSRLPESFVIARSTALTYKDKAIDVRKIGRELGVRYALEGSVRRVGDRIALNAQLVSTETGAHVWADHFDGDRSKLGELQVEFVARLANSLGVELVKAESLRAMRERAENPDAVDLAMRGDATLSSRRDKDGLREAKNLFERALALDPQNARARKGLAVCLIRLVNRQLSDDPASDIARAENLIDGVLALRMDDSDGHRIKGTVLVGKHQWEPAIAEAELAIALDRNNARAHADAGYWKLALGHAEDGFAGVETALRLSPRDAAAPTWHHYLCALHTQLAQWEKAIEWCNRAIAGRPDNWHTVALLTAANAWAGHDKEANDGVAQLQKVHPGFTVRTFTNMTWSDNPTFKAQFARVAGGLRKAGVPEQ